ncbi:MAG: hypothetical protein DSZ31_06345 [Gammaproteobacteria bacterium]|nr:MAG: hypothetical protein DSZ31_06345 [Gammaproteobacteria bacterium]
MLESFHLPPFLFIFFSTKTDIVTKHYKDFCGFLKFIYTFWESNFKKFPVIVANFIKFTKQWRKIFVKFAVLDFINVNLKRFLGLT